MHAYLSGDCIECMANSDNVVRAGLTPKFKDVERLLDMLDYTAVEGAALRFPPTHSLDAVPEGVHLLSFIPPVTEFAVDVILVRIRLTSVISNFAFFPPPIPSSYSLMRRVEASPSHRSPRRVSC